MAKEENKEEKKMTPEEIQKANEKAILQIKQAHCEHSFVIAEWVTEGNTSKVTKLMCHKCSATATIS